MKIPFTFYFFQHFVYVSFISIALYYKIPLMIKQQILERRSKNVNKEKKLSVFLFFFSVHCSLFTIDTKEPSNEANNSIKSYESLSWIDNFPWF